MPCGTGRGASGETDQLVVRGVDTLAVGGDAFDVATAVGLKANTQYVLYEAEAPDGFGTFADVTFTVDDRDAVQLVDGAWNGDTLNAYTAGSTLSAVDYTHKELVDKKVQQREQPQTLQTSGKKISKLMQTGDQTPVTALVVAGLVALGGPSRSQHSVGEAPQALSTAT